MKEISGNRNAFLAIIAAFALQLAPLADAKAILFRQAVDSTLPAGLQGHLMDLKGAWSVAANASMDSQGEGKTGLAYGVIPLSANPDRALHGYYLSPSYFYSEGKSEGQLKYFGNSGWQLVAGRGNLAFPGSIYRGFLQVGYRQSSLNDDDATREVLNSLSLSKDDEERKSILISTGVSSTQSSLVSQRRPFLDSELILNIRYDYESGDLFTHAKGSLFYPTWVEIGAAIAWFKVFTEEENVLFDEVSDDFVGGPRVRGRAFNNHLGFDLSLDWHCYRNVGGSVTVPPPRAQLTLIANF